MKITQFIELAFAMAFPLLMVLFFNMETTEEYIVTFVLWIAILCWVTRNDPPYEPLL